MPKLLQKAFLIVAAMVACGFIVATIITATISIKPLEGEVGLACEIPLRRSQSQQHIFDRVLETMLFGKVDIAALKPEKAQLHIEQDIAHQSYREAPTHVANVSDAVLILTYANGREAWESLRTSLAEDDALVIEGMLRQALQPLGETISLDHDILPLLQNPGSLQLTSSGGSLAVLLEGSMEKKTTLNQTLDRIHVSFGDTLPSLRVTRRVLDKRFSSVDIRHDTSMILEEQNLHLGWTVRQTVHPASRRGLYTAVRNHRFLVSTNRALLEKALHDRKELPLPTKDTSGTLLLGGYLDPAALPALLYGISVSSSEALSQYPFGSIEFATVQSGETRQRILRAEKKEKLLDYLLRNL